MIELSLKSRAGIVESGLFVRMAEMALVGTDQGVDRIAR
jgi:ribose 5-phosphate isomerase